MTSVGDVVDDEDVVATSDVGGQHGQGKPENRVNSYL